MSWSEAEVCLRWFGAWATFGGCESCHSLAGRSVLHMISSGQRSSFSKVKEFLANQMHQHNQWNRSTFTPDGGRQIIPELAMACSKELKVSGSIGLRGRAFQILFVNLQWRKICAAVSASPQREQVTMLASNPRLWSIAPKGRAPCSTFQIKTWILGAALMLHTFFIQLKFVAFWGWADVLSSALVASKYPDFVE